MSAEKKILRTDVHVERDGQSVVLSAGSAVPGWAKSLITNPKAFAPAEPAGESEEEETEEGYGSFTVEDLQAELKGRELPVSGNKSELIERLEAHDRETEQNKGA